MGIFGFGWGPLGKAQFGLGAEWQWEGEGMATDGHGDGIAWRGHGMGTAWHGDGMAIVGMA